MLHALRLLREDLAARERAGGGSVSAVTLYRLAQGARALGLTPVEVALGALNAVANGCVFGRGADLGPGLVLTDPRGVVVEGKVRAGARLRLDRGASLGDAARRGCPVVGDDVTIAAEARLIGPVGVGDGARVEAGAVVVKDVPPETTVGGVPAVPGA